MYVFVFVFVFCRPETVLVPVLVNLLPKYASASVTGYECPENSSIGLIMLTVNPSKHEDKSVKCFVLFHLEDVVDEGGNLAFHNPSVTVKSLKNAQVKFSFQYYVSPLPAAFRWIWWPGR